MMQVNDEQLVNRCLSGDRDAFGELVMRYQGVVRGLAYHLVGNFEDAKDLAQESFVRAYVRLSDLQDRAKFASWLKRVTYSVCMNWLKANRRDRVASLESEASEQHLHQIADSAYSPIESAEAKELRETVLQAVGKLPEIYRLPLTLFHLDGLSYNKVADFLDVPVGTVKWRLNQARGMLRKGMLRMVAEVFEEHKPDEKFTEETMEKISLLVADKSASRDVLAKRLRKQGYNVDTVEDSAAALERLGQADYQAVIIDVRKRDFELLEQIIQQYPNTTVITTTAYGNVDEAVEAMRLGAYDYIEKPFPMSKLLLVVSRAIKPRAATQEGQEVRSCPKCNRKMQLDWKYCPYDGTSIE